MIASVLVSLGGISQAEESVDDIVNEIKALEKARDPKCYATASRLEDFMFGTPLTDEARFRKNLLQKSWAKIVWERASKIASAENKAAISQSLLMNVIAENFTFKQDEKKHWAIKFAGGQEVRINKEDKRQYSTIAYALRAILAVQQESLMDLDSTLLPLHPDAIKSLKDSLDLFSLAVLKITDAKARKKNEHDVKLASLNDVWSTLLNLKNEELVTKPKTSKNVADLSIVRKIIQQKVESYAAYNQISNQLFVRNLQVYFARLSWPKDPEEGKRFKNLFTETMIQFANDLYKETEKIALKNGHGIIMESDVHELIQQFIPHEINEYEDAIFFPKLPRGERVNIESYDMDSFRDSGIHWRYLEFALNEPGFKAQLQPDPFALELMVENIAQFGVLSLRLAGEEGKRIGASRLKQSYFVDGLKLIQRRVTKHSMIKDKSEATAQIVSAKKRDVFVSEKTAMFSDTTESVGIDLMHRSSDWLNRLLRSYLDKGKGVGVITIPPAFGGSGVAAEDINNDGFIDLLILSGLGNKLYLNDQGKRFVDITKQSGIDWKRPEDNTPGEPRQPLIADLNNDGLQDIVITYVNDKHRVYQNLGNAKFKDLTDVANLGGADLVGGPATVADFDNDGLLDIYVTYFGHYTKGILPTLKRRNDNGLPNQLFKNTGNFKFKNVTENSNTGDTGWAQAIAHTDFNSDGRQDLIVGNDFGVNVYFENLGNGKFRNVAADLGTDKPSYTMNIGIGDLNQDLRPDIYISNIVTMNKDEKYVLPNEDTTMKFNAEKLANMRVVEANDLFLSGVDDKGNLSYELSDAVGRGYSSTGWSWDADFFDYDNDGDSDLYVLNGMNEFNLYSNENPYYTDPHSEEQKDVYIPVSTKESNVFFVNSGGKLVNQSKNSGLDLIGNSRSAAYLDFDNDGDLDIIVNNYHQEANFYTNNLNKKNNHWVKLKLIGDVANKSNRDAIGAQIILTTNDNRKIWREIHGSIGYMSVHPKMQHFGLGESQIKLAEIIWPNGQRQILENIELGKLHVIKQENSDRLSTVGSK
ncbi:CRTAC1 family protein [Aliikangiella coralliicola]|uniref:CRTAC1 family protein n=1 Tax=Aliikangiella coralliicola TaxID=2592383 RepID=A0A545TSM9_9GAMM|nr:CRTAC1 family protein [Aliikangiella coralliicola]TQV80225.1 CRTAC1 family protein [Aliikangiella coralliicola]